MRKSKINLRSTAAFLPISVGLLGMSLTSAGAATYGGAIGLDTGPGEIITVTNIGATVSSTGQGPYDGSDDTYIGVLNNSSSAISSLTLSCGSNGCFGFDGDGIDRGSYLNITANASDKSSGGYGGPNAYFTTTGGTPIVSTNAGTGVVHFLTAIAGNGGTSFFSLEEALTSASFSVSSIGTISSTPLPSTWTMLLLGLIGVGFAASRTTTKQSSVAIA
jgi:hypothetical protein